MKLTEYSCANFLPGFSTLGSTGPIEKLKGGREGEKWSQFSDKVNSMLTGLGNAGLKITAGQQTMSGLITDLTGPTHLAGYFDRSFLDTNILFSI